MKLIIVTLLVIVMEALGYGWLLGEECEQLKAENRELKQKITVTEIENSKIQWDLMLTRAGVPQDEE